MIAFKSHRAEYKLVYSEGAKKELSKLEKPLAKKVEKKIADLARGQDGLDIKKLVGYKEPTYRLRVGDVRVIYSWWHEQVIIYVIQVGHRREIYQR